jgi:VRR-NUC domain-containing protein
MYLDDLVTEFGSAGRKRRHEEDDLQAQVCTFLKWALPQDATFWAVPNGGRRHPKEAARMVRLGVRAGVPDLCVAYRGRLYCLELKADSGVLSEHQLQMHAKLEKCAVPVAVCRSVGAVEVALKLWDIPLSARLS